MIRTLLFLLLTGWSAAASGQTYKRTLRGEVRIPGHSPQYYYIYYTASGASISGYSVTQSDNGDLRATLVGRLSDDGTELYLRETETIDFIPPGTELCFFAARLRLTIYPDRRVWQGAFSSRQPNGQPCEGGTMTFVDLNPKPPPPPKPKAETPKPAPLKPKIEAPKPKPKPIVRDTVAKVVAAPKPMPDTPVRRRDTVVVTKPPVSPPDTSRLRQFYRWFSGTMTFEIWDGVKEDGDAVTVLFNGKPVLEAATLTNEKRSFTVPISPSSVDTLTVLMLKEGNLPGNTTRLNLVGSDQRYELSINGSYGDKASFYFMQGRR